MGSVRSNGYCSKCGNEKADLNLNYSTDSEFLFCYRCGYLHDKRVATDDSTTPPSTTTTIFEKGGIGCCLYRETGENMERELHTPNSSKHIFLPLESLFNTRPEPQSHHRMIPMHEKTVEDLKCRLHTLDFCRYTFLADEEWWVKDLLTDEVRPFSFQELCPDVTYVIHSE